MKPRANTSHAVGMSEGLRGQLYQIALSMMLFTRGVFRKYENFKLETEVKNASVFDDVVFDENNGRYRMIQLKHKTSKYKEVLKGCELFQTRGDFCLLKYVCAWIHVQNENSFKGKVKDAIVFTNVSLDIDSETNSIKLAHKQRDMKELFQNVEVIRAHEVKLSENDILYIDKNNHNGTVKYYRFTDETVVDLLLRQIAILKIMETTRHDMMKMLENISVTEINDALEHIIYACNQPDEEELFGIIHDEIQSHFKLHSADTVFNKLKVHLTEWVKAKTVFNHVITYNEAQKFFEMNVKSIAFDILLPITSFVGRTIELQLVREKLVKSVHGVAIHGLGGVGKTQLARMYVQKYKDDDYFGRVVWINAENNNTCERSFKELAERLGITYTNNHEINGSFIINDSHKSIKTIISNVIDYFNDLKVLFVLDNVEHWQTTDNLSYLRSIIHSQKAPPHILITSRDRSLSHGMQHLNLNVLTISEACDCIQNQLNVTYEDAEKLAKLLQCYPLAIQQAVAFINQQNEALKVFKQRLTINDYILMYHTKANQLLNYKTQDDFSAYSNTTLITWDITIEAIRTTKEHGKDAIKLLQLLAFVPPDNTNPRMFLPLFPQNPITQVASAIHLLEKYSMISQNDGILQIHRLVQKVMQLKISKENQTESTLHDLIFILQHKFDMCHTQIQITEHVIEQLLEQKMSISNYFNIEFPFGGNLIHYAARNGNVDVLKLLLKTNVDINEINSQGETPLHLACLKSKLPAVKFLVENGADLFVKDVRGWTAVHRAAQGGDVNILSYLLKNCADLSAKDKIGRNALHEAAMAGQMNMIKFLLTQNIDIASEANNGRNVLHAAAFAGNIEIVQFLINEGADLFCKDHNGRTVLHSATFGGHTNMIRFLMNEGLDLDTRDFDGVSALHEAAYNGDMEVVTFLLNNGTDVKGKDRCGKTAMHEAALGSQTEMMDFLSSFGLKFDETDNEGRNIMHMASIAGDIDLIKYLLTKEIKLNSTDFFGRTTLHFAVANNKLNVVQFCLENGMDINSKDYDGKTSIHWGVECRNIEMMNFLLEHEVNLFERDNFGRTAIHWAAMTTNVEMIEFLVTKGIDVTQEDNEGRNALHWASLSGCIEMIECLLNQDISIESLDNHGRSALDWAKIGGSKEAIVFLSGKNRAAYINNKYIKKYQINIYK